MEDLSFPLFLTSRLLLLALDASVDGRAFFPRDEDLGLRDPIPGWGAQDDIFHIIPAGVDYLMDSDDEEGEFSTRMSGVAPNWVSEPKCTETDLKKSQICLIFDQSDPIWPQP